MSSVKASVILTSYNKPKYLKRAIESCLAQDYPNLEIIIADDNSPNPDVWNVINSYSDKRIISFNSFISDEDRLKTARYATQINLAVREYSTGEYLFYLADDDYFYPKMITKMINYASKFSRDVCFCAQHIVDTSGNIDGGGIEGRGVRFFPEALIRGADKLDHNQVMTSRKAFYYVNGWNDEPWCWSGADAIFYDRLEKAGYLFYPIDTEEPLQAKMYRENSVQWNMTNGLSPIGEES
jgi:spore maturation protein CgeD